MCGCELGRLYRGEGYAKERGRASGKALRQKHVQQGEARRQGEMRSSSVEEGRQSCVRPADGLLLGVRWVLTSSLISCMELHPSAQSLTTLCAGTSNKEKDTLVHCRSFYNSKGLETL